MPQPGLSDNGLSDARRLTRQLGLVCGLVAFAVTLWAPPIPGLFETATSKMAAASDEGVAELAGSAQRTLALTLLMVIWWITEAVPIPVTALLPGCLLPLLQVTGVRNGAAYAFTSQASFAGYASPVIFLFLAGFLLAGAMRKTGLDRRITLAFLCWGPLARGPGTILLSIMVVTALLSMWISNTATTAMMLPIAVGVLQQLGERPGGSKFGCALLLGVAWSASIGGIATIVGSPPNGIATEILALQHTRVNFVQWMLLGLPVSGAGVLAAWLLLMLLFRPAGAGGSAAAELLRQQRRSQPPFSAAERVTLVVFATVVLLWTSHPFWHRVLPQVVHERLSWLGIYEIGLLCALMLFVIPCDVGNCRSVLNWRDSHYVDWGTLLLFGGGIALSQAMASTGLTQWIAGGVVDRLQTVSPWLCVAAILLLVDFLTEITSNTAVTTMMTPILIAVSPALGLDVTVTCMAAAMAASMAFMLPVATPPNALVYGTGYFRIGQMMRAGVLMNLVGCGIVLACLFALAGNITGHAAAL